MKKFSEKNLKVSYVKKFSACYNKFSFNMNKSIFFYILFFLVLSAFPAVTQNIQKQETPDAPPPRPFDYPPPHPNPMHFNGKRMMKSPKPFSLIGLKADTKDEQIAVMLFFNEPVDSGSIHSDSIFIDDIPLSPQTVFHFNKNRHIIVFFIENKNESFSLKIDKVISFDGKPLRPVKIDNIEPEKFIKYSQKEKTWKEKPRKPEF